MAKDNAYIRKLVKPHSLKVGDLVPFSNGKKGEIEGISDNKTGKQRVEFTIDIIVMRGVQRWKFYLYCSDDEYVEVLYKLY